MTRVKHSPDRIRDDFWAKVKKDDPEHPGCWVYTPKGRGAKGGYGYVKDFDRKVVRAHVFAVELVSGKKVPKGFEVHHRTEGNVCTTRRCVRYELLPNGNPNPANHIKVVTETENARRATAKRVEELLKEDGIDPDTYAERVLPPEMRPGFEDLPKTGLVGLSAPQLLEFYREVVYGRLMQRVAKWRAARLIQDDREDESFFVPPPENRVPDPLGTKAPCRIKVHREMRCGWDILERFERGAWHRYTFEEAEGRYVPHRMVCHVRTREYSMEDFDDSWELLNIPPEVRTLGFS